MAWGREWVAATLLALMAGCGGESLPMGEARETGGAFATGGGSEAPPGTGGELTTGETGGAAGGSGPVCGELGDQRSCQCGSGFDWRPGVQDCAADGWGDCYCEAANGGAAGAAPEATGGQEPGGSGTGGAGICVPSSVEIIDCPDGSEGQRICHYSGTRWTVMCPEGTGGAATGGSAGAAGSSGETGGEETGGSETGGTSTGGELATGGNTGGTEPIGGTTTGGVATGGSSTGGQATGGAPPIGAGRWVLDGTCVRLEAQECVHSSTESCGACSNTEPGPCSDVESPLRYEWHSCPATSVCEECENPSLNCDGLDSTGCEVSGSPDGTCLGALTSPEPMCVWGEFGVDHSGEPCGDCYACVPICQG